MTKPTETPAKKTPPAHDPEYYNSRISTADRQIVITQSQLARLQGMRALLLEQRNAFFPESAASASSEEPVKA